VIHDSPNPDEEAAMTAVSDAWFDESAGIPGPAFWEAVLHTESARSARYRRPSTIVLAATVGFDDIVDQWGRTWRAASSTSPPSSGQAVARATTSRDWPTTGSE
jgi:hypothetical protein